jgi:capsular exopolysaccharide synthesis family protein
MSASLSAAARPDREQLPSLRARRAIEEWDPLALDEGVSLLDIPTLLAVLWRWRLLFIGVVTAVTLAAVLWAIAQTPLYKASATLELNPSPARVVEMGDQEEPQQPDRDYLALQVGLLKSRNLADRVTRRLNLGRDAAFLGSAPREGSAATASNRLMDGLTATGTASDRIVRISFVHPNPEIAARVANAYASQAIDSNFERAYESTARSRQFLQRQLENTRQQLERSERELIAYAREANIINLVTQEGASSGDSAGGTLVASNLVDLNRQLSDAQNARIVAQQRYAQSAASASAATVADPTVQTLQQQRAQLQAEYDQNMQRYFPDHPVMASLRARLEGLQTQISQASGRTAGSVRSTLRADFVAAQNREAQLQGTINRLQSQLLDLNDRGVRYTILRRAVEAHRSLHNALLEKLGEENTSATRTSQLAIIDNARAPGSPFWPNVPRTMVLGLLAGVVLGVGASVGAERWKDTINVPDDVKHLGLPILGVIPKLSSEKDVDAALRDPRSPLAEAYHSTRAALQFLSEHGVPSSILFTSSRESEGKTSSVIAIAADFISVGLRVVVVDADLRKPSIKGGSREGGLSSVLTGHRTLEQEVKETETPNLYLVHAGVVPPNPTTLLAGKGFREAVRQLEVQFDVVIIDAPPVLGLADAPLVSAVAQATVLVIEAGGSRRAVAAESINRLVRSGAVVVGAILNKFDRSEYGYGYGYGGYYQYEYGGEGRKRSLIGPPADRREA